MTDHLDKAQRSWNMSRIRGKDRSPEMAVRKMQHAADFRFCLCVKDLSGKPDIVLPKCNIFAFGPVFPNLIEANLPYTSQ